MIYNLYIVTVVRKRFKEFGAGTTHPNFTHSSVDVHVNTGSSD